MILLAVLVALALGAGLLIIKRNVSKPQEKFIVGFVYYALLTMSFLVLASELAGSDWPQPLQMGAFIYVGVHWCWKVWSTSFWGILFYQALFVVHLIVGGYLYSATQIPYGDEPFLQISSNQPHELEPKNFPHYWISGLPVIESGKQHEDGETTTVAVMHDKTAAVDKGYLEWDKLQQLMQLDSRIKRVLQNLKEKQERDLSEMLAQLNYLSVTNTQMRRRALDMNSVKNLLKERAISSARYRTLVETWNLLDSDERAFRKRQGEERFHALLELLEDDKIDESHKVEFINFMVAHFAGDVRLLNPLIQLYDHLDHDYPRQKRLNHAFLDLYIARSNALLQGFFRIGQPALQPLLDYRSRTIADMSYAKARLDRFINSRFGVRVPSLYYVAEGQSAPDFLNRRKYPILEKMAGASFEQDYIRRDLLQTMFKNRPPKGGESVQGYPVADYGRITELLTAGEYDDRIDYLVIDADPVVRANLAWNLAERKDPYLMPIIFELMRDSHPEVRRLAAIAIGNFRISDTQGASDPKFIEIVRMLQNYRSNSDAFGRSWGLLSLSNSADKQKVLYVIDLILNDGGGYHSTLGAEAPTWRSDEEQQVIASLADTLEKTPEELLVKTYALSALIALNSPESLGILLEYLHHIYETQHTRPSMWRYFVPHLTLPQEAENVEDVIVYLAKHKEAGLESVRNRHLKALHEYLRKAYKEYRSGEFFQMLRFLNVYDATEYDNYLQQNEEQVRIMRMREYAVATDVFWLCFWLATIIATIFVIYVVVPFFNIATPKRARSPNAKANPAADSRQQAVAPAPTIVPVKIAAQK